MIDALDGLFSLQRWRSRLDVWMGADLPEIILANALRRIDLSCWQPSGKDPPDWVVPRTAVQEATAQSTADRQTRGRSPGETTSRAK